MYVKYKTSNRKSLIAAALRGMLGREVWHLPDGWWPVESEGYGPFSSTLKGVITPEGKELEKPCHAAHDMVQKSSGCLRGEAANSRLNLYWDEGFGGIAIVSLSGRRGSIADVWRDIRNHLWDLGEVLYYETSSPWLRPGEATREALRDLLGERGINPQIIPKDLRGFRASSEEEALHKLASLLRKPGLEGAPEAWSWWEDHPEFRV